MNTGVPQGSILGPLKMNFNPEPGKQDENPVNQVRDMKKRTFLCF